MISREFILNLEIFFVTLDTAKPVFVSPCDTKNEKSFKYNASLINYKKVPKKAVYGALKGTQGSISNESFIMGIF